ncbi:MAG: Fis family transcriptional regulator [Thioalkalivibrio sp.]|nr:MAG: Fis family transcriptional regulator [Thioalkalivibrio sp.]
MVKLDKHSRLQPFACLLAALILCAPAAGAVEAEAELEATREAMRALEREQQERLSEIERLEERAAGVARRSQDLRDEQRRLRAAVAEQDRAVADRQQEADEREAELATARDQALQLLRSQWLRERHRAWTPDDAELARHQRHLDGRIQLRREEVLARIAAQAAALVEARDRLAAARDELIARETEARRTLREIAVREEELAALLVRVEEQVESDAMELERLARNAETLEGVLRRMEEQPQARPDGRPPAATPGDGARFSTRRGALPQPVEGGVLHRYGSPRNGGVHASWRGEVFETGGDAQVRAVHHGQTVYADWMRGYGFVVILDHGEGYLTLYGNARELLTRSGEQIAGGDVIARAGGASAAIAPGLYFELRHRGETLNPRPWWDSN